MKKWIIGSLVGAILLFLWQFLSWAALELHDKEYKYLPAQDQLMAAIQSNVKEDGQYMLPNTPPNATNADKEKMMTEMAGKPYAIVAYKSSYKMDSVMQMIRSFLVDFVIALLLIYVLGKRANLTMGSVWMASLAIGFIAWLWQPYTAHIWFQTPVEVITGALMDWFVAFSLLGVWLGFWLRRV